MFGRKGTIQPTLCAVTFSVRGLVTGVACGDLYLWNGRSVAKVVKAHNDAVTALHTAQDKLVSGSRDRTVKVWDENLTLVKAFDMTIACPGAMRASICSVCVDPGVTKIAVGTLGSEIYELCYHSGSATLLNEGHCEHELWGLATHPNKPHIFATSGDDNTVRVWNTASRMIETRTNVDTMTRAIAWSPNGDLLAVGTGGVLAGESPEESDRPGGALIVITADNMEIVHEGRDSKECIQDVRFSPDGTCFAVASRDSNIYLYDVTNGFSLKGKCQKHSSFLTHVDFSANSKWLQSTCGGFELMYYDADTGSHNPTGGAELRDMDWSSWTLPFGWPVKGLWQKGEDAEEARPDILAVDRDHDNSLLAVGDAAGRVRVFTYPCAAEGDVESVQGRAHAANVTNVRFSSDSSHLITVGGRDRVICQWKVIQPPPVPEEEEVNLLLPPETDAKGGDEGDEGDEGEFKS